ncbi:hypothetical protein EXH46_10955 [Pelomonas puraquae]|uniref:LysR substrate-binding domain-containing protein n=1 Tax=Roseateles puraquae TaxID=431059 RepID=A0A254NFD2_9BURK|nr:hypothetical protein [Roseateles puraquae]OWR03813.1 hypothetical protein CDO81_13955 [Roseateles puraquae]
MTTSVSTRFSCVQPAAKNASSSAASACPRSSATCFTKRASASSLGSNGAVPLRHPDDLLAHNCIVYSELARGNAWSFVAGPGAGASPGSVHTVRAAGNLQTNASEVIRASVLAGMGIGYAPLFLFEAELANGEVERLLPEWTVQDLPLHLVSPPQRRQSAKVRAFGDHLVATGI